MPSLPSLLHLDSSANRSGESVSRQLTARFADTWRAAHGPAAGYRYRDLAADPVPPLDTAYCVLGRRLEREGLVPPQEVDALLGTPAEKETWELTHPLITELLTADTVVIGAPMYNYAVSASLKAWIDRITFPGAFTDPATGGSALRGTKVVVLGARGGAYGPGTPREGWDFQTPYLRKYFAGLGVRDENLRFVTAELTVAPALPALAEFRPLATESLAAARAETTALAH
ncbi:NAD(P)H dehydrogenase [Streptomyces sp. AcH 505]|uniref:FMN-dependent NADH-azoreductase n=1 Tax=unclassified Streptomyces TaxID=2593676 RepID=UPI000591B7FE|nr:NAD(P)H-dependent oxidoreductase [Streptomyces sp. NBC_00370]KIF68450.1 NAD(P)H dehydrogenase [Streptomyces sp. AcH 505]